MKYWIMEFTSFLPFMIFIVIMTAIMITPVVTLALWSDSKTCYNRWNESGYNSRWSVWTDCQVFVDNKWIPADNFYYKKDVNN